MRNNIEKIDWDKGNLFQSKDKEGRKTVDDVFDQNTLKTIQQLISRGHISTIENIIATGKEANVFRAKTTDGRNRAVKIFRINQPRIKR